MIIKYKLIICALRNYCFESHEKNSNLDRDSKLGPVSGLALCHLSCTGSIDGGDLNLSLESNAMQGVVVCDTICHHLTGELTSALFIYFDI